MNEIIKVKFKSESLEVTYKERFVEENYYNEVTKSCSQIVHGDLKRALDALVPHLALLAEQKYGEIISGEFLQLFDHKEQLKEFVVTGYSLGGSEDTAGVTIIGQRLLKSGKVLNLVAPFQMFVSQNDSDDYFWREELHQAVINCNDEVEEYLFNGKFGIKQLEIDFDGNEINADATDEKPKKRGRKSKLKIDDAVVTVQVSGIEEQTDEPDIERQYKDSCDIDESEYKCAV